MVVMIFLEDNSLLYNTRNHETCAVCYSGFLDKESMQVGVSCTDKISQFLNRSNHVYRCAATDR